jgi:hypothetical protein
MPGGGDEGEIVGEERGIEAGLDARDIDAAVFGEGMIAVNQQGAESECGQCGMAKAPPSAFGNLGSGGRVIDFVSDGQCVCSC